MICIIDCGTEWLENIEQNLGDLDCSYETIKVDKMKECDFEQYSGIIITGAPLLLTQVDLKKYLESFKFIKSSNYPILGICLGHQIMGLLYGSEIQKGDMVDKMEQIEVVKSDGLYSNIGNNSLFREEHSEFISLPEEFKLLAKSKSCDNESMKHKDKPLYGVQFHPEVSGEPGKQIFKNYVNMCR